MTRTRSSVTRTPHQPVSRPHDPAERQADQAADVVARGGSVTGWSFASVTPTPVHRQEKEDKPAGKTTEEKLAEGGNKVVEAALETETGKKIVEKVKESEPVKALKKAAASTPGKIVGGAALAGTVAGQIATGKNLPFSLPDVPLGGGWSIKPQIDTPITKERHPGVTITFAPQGAGAPKRDTKAETAALRASLEMWKPKQQQAAEEAEIAAMLAAWHRGRGLLPLVPLAPGAKPEVVQKPPSEPKQEKESDRPAEPVQREPASPSTESDQRVPDTSGVEASLRGSGRPLDASLRRSMEARFGHDFRAVRIHDDSTANAAASRLDAAAYTVGSDLVFAAGRYSPQTPHGRHLLAHELAHVVQQRGTDTPPHVHRRSGWDTFLIWLGVEEGTWTDQELHAYLDAITASGEIDGSYDADNKARAIVARWKAGSPGYDLLGNQKALLIKEMQDGPTLDEDEDAILDLLELSDAGDLRSIFGTGGVTLRSLDEDFQGERQTRLDAFVASRFTGGRAALEAGRVDVTGGVVPTGAPAYGFDAATLDARFDSDRTPEELIALLDRFSPADREQALHHLSQVRRPRMLDAERRVIERLQNETDAARQQALRDEVTRMRADRLRTERVLLHYFHGSIPVTEADLRSGTTPADPARQTELQEALRPERSPTATTFNPQLPGETQDYEAKIRALLPRMVDAYYAETVTNRPARTHTLAEFEAIGNVSKDETDAVFGQFYSAAAHPAFVADTPRRRGNLHDAFAETERELRRMSRPQRRQMARALLFYFFQSNSRIRRINRAHGASPRFDNRSRPQNQEARILASIADDFTSTPTRVRRLNEIDRGWDASARGREVYVQLFEPTDTAEDRLLLWDMFQTLIHEYMHTLSQRRYSDYAESFGNNSNEYNTLIEGVDCLLSEIVWEHVQPRVGDATLRQQVEGPTYAALPAIDVPHPSMRRYPSYTEALRLADLVGIHAVYAAYFLGLVDRIGGPPPRRRRP
jgi:hypothetical protein